MFLKGSDNHIYKAFLVFCTIAMAFSGTALAIPQHVVDYDGDARTDFSVTRRVVNNIVWYNYDGFSTPPAGITALEFGLAVPDTLVPEDFDGDNKTDIAIWRRDTVGPSGFYVLRSIDFTVTFDPFGLPNDNPSVVADYDGDGKADSAVYRCPESVDGECYFFYHSSLTGALGAVQWGFGTSQDLSPYIGDFDGDLKADICIQQADPTSPVHAQFVMLRSSDGGVEYIPWGLANDLPVAGDYDGDGKTDFCVRRNAGGNSYYYVLTRTGNIFAEQWGVNADVSTPGDYDGDGKTDFAVWRGSQTGGESRFYVLLSQTGAVKTVPWGACSQSGGCDLPVASWILN